jgi:hypothetical protein
MRLKSQECLSILQEDEVDTGSRDLAVALIVDR